MEVNGVAGTVDRAVGVDVADQFAGRLADRERAGIGGGRLRRRTAATVTRRVGLRDRDRGLERAVGAVTPVATGCWSASTRTRHPGIGSPLKRLAAKTSSWPGAVLVTRPTSDTTTTV